MQRRKFFQLIAAFALTLIGRSDASAQSAVYSNKKREIVLLDAFVAGWQYHQGDSVLSSLATDTPLKLHREPQNPYDEMAIAVYASGFKLGYVPKIHNTVIAGLMDQNVSLDARVLWKQETAPPWEKLTMRISVRASI